MPNHRRHIAPVFAIALLSALSAAAREELFDKPTGSIEQENDRLVAVLKSDAPQFEKNQACKRLGYLGSDRCVPTLAGLLADEKLSHSARIALQSIPGEASEKALRDALDHAKGRQLAGVINSVGIRRDAAAVKKLTRLLERPNDDVACAAATALGNIATSEAADAIAQAVRSAKGVRLAALQDANLRCAERLIAGGKQDQARRLCEPLLAAKLQHHVRVAAALGMLRSEKESSAAKRLQEYLASSDEAKFEAAIQVARDWSNKSITMTLVAALNGANESRLPVLIDALRIRKDPSVVPQVAAVMQKASPPVKIVALRCIGQIGDRASIPRLVAAATDENKDVADAAIESISQLPGENIDQALIDQLAKSDSAKQRAIIVTLGRRSSTAAAPVLLGTLNSKDEAVRIAALEALSQSVGEKDFAKLLDRIPAAKSEAEKKAAIAAAEAACRRMPNTKLVAALVADRVASWPEPTWPEADRPVLIRMLGAIGGPAALDVIAKAAAQGTPQLQDAATKVLGEWITPDAAPYLYQIASTSDHKYKTRALRGYLRIARQLNLTDRERISMCRQALEIATRPDERELALEILRRCPSAESVELASSLIDDKELKQHAVETAVFIAEKIKDKDPAAAKSAAEKALQANPQGEVADRARALTNP
jgi:HEAT repeat protein